MIRKTAIVTILIIIFTASVFTACKYLSPLVDYYGIVLSTDDAGHFTEEITYKDDSYYYTFKTNGEFEYYSESFEDDGEDHDFDGIFGEGWVKTNGEKGTYSWDSVFFVNTTVVTQEIVDGEWQTVTDKITYEDNVYFTERNFCPVWIGGITFSFGSISGTGYQKERTVSVENSWKYTISKVIELQEDSGNLNYFYKYLVEDASGTVTTDDQTLRQSEYTTLPGDAKFEKAGEPFTIRAKVTSTLYNDGSPDDSDNYYMSWDFIGGGRIGFFSDNFFWIEWPENSAMRTVVE